MADAALPPLPTPESDAAQVAQLQSAGEQNYQEGVARYGGALHQEAVDSMEPPPPTAAEAAAPFGTFTPPPTAAAAPPPPPTAAEAAAPKGSKPAPTPKPVKAPTPPSPEKDPMEFLPWLVHGGWREAGAGPAQIGAETAERVTMAAGAAASVGDKIWDIATGQTRPSGESYHTGMQDAVFNFDKNYIQPAIEHWQTADDAGPVAQGIHQVAGMLAATPYGVAGTAQFISNAFGNSSINAIDKGADTKTAVTQGTIDGAATGLLMHYLGKYPGSSTAQGIPWVKRGLAAIPTGDLINIGSDLTKQLLLSHSGNDKQAQSYKDKIQAAIDSIVQHVTSLPEMVSNFGFGAAAKPVRELTKEGGGPAPKPGAVAPAEGAAPVTKVTQMKSGRYYDHPYDQPPAGTDLSPAPPTPAEAAAPKPADIPPPPGPPASVAAAPKAATPPAPSPVPDTPSAESARDIRSQMTDLWRAGTPRRGVLISPETQAHLDSLPEGHVSGTPVKNQIENARSQGRSVQTPAGELIVKTKGDAIKARAALKAGEDPQLVVGRYTGAGEGKDPSQTVVVQGREVADGSITTERAVRPEDQGMATQAMIDQGKIPVVTTPEGVIAERHVAVQDEKKAAEPPSESDTVSERPASTFNAGPGVKILSSTTRRGPTALESDAAIDRGADPKAVENVNKAVRSGTMSAEDGNAALRAMKGEATPKAPEEANTAPPPGPRPEEIAAPAPAQEAASTTEGFFKTDSGKEVPVHVAGEAVEGKIKVHPLNAEGEPQAAVEVPAERVRTGAAPEAAAKEAPTNEPTQGTALDQLPAALAAHEKSEQPANGRKNPASLKERQDNASAFAQVLGAAAKEAAEKGRAAESTVQRAAAAAAKARGLTNKSKEATEKGQGTSHVIVTIRNKEMHRAARELLGKTQPGEEPAEVGEKKPVKPEQSKPVKKVESVKPKPVAEKAAAAGAKDTARFHSLTERYLKAKDPEAARAARDDLEQHVREVVAKLGKPPEEADAILRHLTDLRAESGRREPPKMSDTLEDEEQEFDRPKEGFQSVYRPSAEAPKEEGLKWHEKTRQVWRAMEHIGRRLSQAGIIRNLTLLQDSGIPMSYHELLDHLDSFAGHDPDLQARIRALRARVPDVPVFFRSEIIDPKTFQRLQGVKGLFHAASHLGEDRRIFDPTMQIELNDNTKAFSFVHAVLHEGEHAATEYAIHHGRQVNSPIVKELDDARDMLEKRLRAKYGDAAIDSAHKYFGKRTPGEAAPTLSPELAHLYGLINTSEMAAEIENNPKFLEEVIRSEDHADPSEKIPPVSGIPGLLHKIVTALGKLLGRDPKLALHIIDAKARVEEMQRNSRTTSPLYEEGAYNQMVAAQPSARMNALAKPARGEPRPDLTTASSRAMAEADDEHAELLTPAKPVKAEGAMRDISTDETVQSARDNIHAIASRSIDMARNAVTALKSVGKLMRDGRGYFGHEDDPNNPMNELQDVDHDRNKMLQAGRQVSNPVAKAWMRASTKDNLDAGALLRDATLWKIDPRTAADKQLAEVKDRPGFEERHAQYQYRYQKMSPEAKEVFDGVLRANKALRGMQRRGAVDAAVEGFGVDISEGQRQLLYSAQDPGAFDRLLKEGGLVDVGDKNEKMRAALRDWVGSEIQGPYAHLGRPGDYVMQATPEGTKEFGSQAEAESFARQARDTSPGSKADAEERGGKWVVDYKIQHVSMHATRAEAEKAREAMSKQGFDTQPVTHKMMTRELATNLSGGMRELVTQAMRKNESAGESLMQAYLHMQAQRSAYAGSQLMRKGFGGVKAKDMRQNFAEHASSSIWHAAQTRVLFRQAAAMARLREMVKTTDDQALAFHRSETVQALNKHAAAANQVNTGGSFNRKAAQLGFLSYLTSAAHSAIWMTQNFSTGIPVAGARYGYGKATAAFMRGMGAVGMPSLRRAVNEQFSKWASPDDIHAAVVKAIESHPTMGKWAPQIRELYARGVISHGYANDLGALAQGSTPIGVRVMDWARVAPAMADAFNRTSTALAGLELTGGDLRKTADLVQEIHADYSAQNKPLAFKALSRVPGGTSLTMFKTYAQAMAELVYSNLYHATVGADFKSEEGRARAWVGAKTVAGVMVGNAAFAGVYGAVGLEPLRMLVYVYHKLFDEEGEVWDMKNAIHHFLVDHLGAAAGNAAARGPIADALGVDVQNRMGLANLFFHDPPDLLTSDKDTWKTWINEEAGPLVQLVANGVTAASGHLQNGEYLQAMLSVLPVKVVQDSLKAMQLLETGKQTGTGGRLTQPSALDAAKQAFGLKPASVADAQEKQGVKTEYSKVQGMVRSSIIRQLLTAAPDSSDHQTALERLQKFNERNPGAGITRREINSEARRNYKTTEGLPSRNQRAEAAADFSGKP